MDISSNQTTKNATPLSVDQFSLHNFSQFNQNKYSYKTNINYRKIFINILILSLVIINSYLIFLFSQTRPFSLAKKLKNSLPLVTEAVQNLGESIETHYNFIFQQSKQKNQILLRLDINTFSTDINNLVAGSYTQRITLSTPRYFNFSLNRTINMIKKPNNKNDSKVLGIYSANKDQTAFISMLRKGKENAAQILDQSQIAKKELDNYKLKLEKKRVRQEELEEILSRIEDNNIQTEQFISQATKTGNYYYKIYDINIKLTSQLGLYLDILKNISISSSPDIYLSQLDEIEYSFLKLQSDLKRIPSNDLPQGMEDLHNYNLRFFQLLVENVKQTKKTVVNRDLSSFVINLDVFANKTINLSRKLEEEEINFWQNNRILRKYTYLIENYNNIIQNLEKFMKEIDKPFLEELSELVG